MRNMVREVRAMIRRATLDDIPACARIVTDWERAQPYLGDTPDMDTVAGFIRDAFADRVIWVVGQPVSGYMSLDPVGGKIGALYLETPGRGMGRQLMDLAKQGRDYLWLTVFEPNTRAQDFYRREGFRFTDRVPDKGGAHVGPPRVLRMDWTRGEARA